MKTMRKSFIVLAAVLLLAIGIESPAQRLREPAMESDSLAARPVRGAALFGLFNCDVDDFATLSFRGTGEFGGGVSVERRAATSDFCVSVSSAIQAAAAEHGCTSHAD